MMDLRDGDSLCVVENPILLFMRGAHLQLERGWDSSPGMEKIFTPLLQLHLLISAQI